MLNSLPRSIAIDGPVAAGKTTVGKLVAQKLNYLCVDTGFFYRAVTYIALKKGLDVKDNIATGNIAQNIDLQIKSIDGRTQIFYENENITPYLRTPAVDKTVAFPSANPIVRSALTPQMRKVANDSRVRALRAKSSETSLRYSPKPRTESPKKDTHLHTDNTGLSGTGVIMLGRDIGTVVLPDADLKIWLDADAPTRAKRLVLEQKQKGLKTKYEEVLADMEKRDKIDSSRKVAPMQKPVDAVTIDTSNLTISQVVKKVIYLIQSSK